MFSPSGNILKSPNNINPNFLCKRKAESEIVPRQLTFNINEKKNNMNIIDYVKKPRTDS